MWRSEALEKGRKLFMINNNKEIRTLSHVQTTNGKTPHVQTTIKELAQIPSLILLCPRKGRGRPSKTGRIVVTVQSISWGYSVSTSGHDTEPPDYLQITCMEASATWSHRNTKGRCTYSDYAPCLRISSVLFGHTIGVIVPHHLISYLVQPILNTNCLFD